jgi:hypothetical protein
MNDVKNVNAEPDREDSSQIASLETEIAALRDENARLSRQLEQTEAKLKLDARGARMLELSYQ